LDANRHPWLLSELSLNKRGAFFTCQGCDKHAGVKIQH
jgi:hypothetical protein